MDERKEGFGHFYKRWLSQHHDLLHRLLRPSEPPNISLTDKSCQDQQYKALIDEVVSHYRQYFQEKSNAAKQNPCLVFNPPWLTPIERAFLWISDFKPSLLFRLLNVSVSDLSPEQYERLAAVKDETTREERTLSDAIARVQETAAAPPLVDLVRTIGRLANVESFDFLSAIDAYKESVLVAMEKADSLRRSTGMEMMEILRPAQCVKFLAAALKLQLDVRRWGLEKEAQSADPLKSTQAQYRS
ncbi:hypothetical protein Nepgr_018334 [Nepenthes gracilis]|uniref:DOG1 domain-containing protein n=1 Tax=Nepenthes gracilis TaxID=150966 RepID=A0AAD3SS21_NEPGR|nr:hypothetical protein Nepgr_018334 [Nepenthes gracilis]